MKRLFLIAGLCVAAALIAPIASASAATLTGSCHIVGNAGFTGGLLNEEEKLLGYTFTSEAGSECQGVSSTGATVTGAATVSVKNGTFKGTCLTATSVIEGEGTLTASNGEIFNFKLAFHAAGGNVVLVVTGEGGTKATGDAEFLTSGTQALECRTAGVANLKFQAVAVGQL